MTERPAGPQGGPQGGGRPCTDDEACAAALAALGLSPGRLRRLLADRSPRDAWDAVVAGTHPQDPEGHSHRVARPGLPEEMSLRCLRSAVEVVVLGSDRYPRRLAEDPDAPAVLFVRGEPARVSGRPVVAVVGTRSATTTGRETAFGIGRALAEAGAVVVSGLAPGIDLSALSGALSAGASPALAVLGSAHDDIVRPDQRRLAQALAETGAVLSELPPGAPGARWRFAVRNRILAGLAALVVVVECHESGGALHTVRFARRRAVTVAAVPGSTASSASEGTNALLVEGASCVRHGADAVALVEQSTAWEARVRPGPSGQAEERARRQPLDAVAARVLDSLGADPVTLDAVVLRSGASLAAASLAVHELAHRGLVRGEGGFWWRRPPRRSSGRRRQGRG